MQHSTKYTVPFNEDGCMLDLHLPDETKFGLIASTARQIMARAAGRPEEGTDHRLPVLVFWHGNEEGTIGHRTRIPEWLLNDALSAGFAVVCPDYGSLRPDAQDESQEVAKDLYTWVEQDLPETVAQHGSQTIHPDKLVVVGQGDGAYFASLVNNYAALKTRVLAYLSPQASLLPSLKEGASTPVILATDSGDVSEAVKRLEEMAAGKTLLHYERINTGDEDPKVVPAILKYLQ